MPHPEGSSLLDQLDAFFGPRLKAAYRLTLVLFFAWVAGHVAYYAYPGFGFMPRLALIWIDWFTYSAVGCLSVAHALTHQEYPGLLIAAMIGFVVAGFIALYLGIV